MIMWNELGISGGTAIVIFTGKKTDEDVRNEKELKELGFELEDK